MRQTPFLSFVRVVSPVLAASAVVAACSGGGSSSSGTSTISLEEAGQAIGAGGFDALVSLFSGTGPSALLIGANDDGAGVATDASTGNALLYLDGKLRIRITRNR